MLRHIVLGVALPMLLAAPAHAAGDGRVAEPATQQEAPQGLLSSLFRGTEAEQAACRPDAMRLCQAEVPDPFRVLSCFKQQRNRLSKACEAVLESHGQ